MSENLWKDDKLCRDYIESLYEGKTGFIEIDSQEIETLKEQNVFSLYSEILYESVNKILEQMIINKKDVLYDLGSGVGKIPLQFFLKTPIKKAFGIEAILPRHLVAWNVYQEVKKAYPNLFKNGRKLQSFCSNILEFDFSDATILIIALYDETLLEAIGKKIDENSNIKYVASLKPIPCKLKNPISMGIDCTFGQSEILIYGI